MPVQIVANQLKNNAVETDKIANNAVSPAKADLSQIWAFSAAPTFSGSVSSGTQLVNKNYVDNLVNGLTWKEAVRVRAASDVDLSGPGASIDGVNLASGDRVLISNQDTSTEEGLYQYNGAAAAMTRTADGDTYQKLEGLAVLVKEGTSANQQYHQSADNLSSFSGQTYILLSSTSGGRTVDTSKGLALDGNQLEVKVDNLSIEFDGSGRLEVKDGGIDNDMLAGSIAITKLVSNAISFTAGSGLTGGGAGVQLGSSVSFAVQAEDASISVGAGGIKVGAGQISASHLAANAVTSGAVQDAAITTQKLANLNSANILMGNASNRPTAVQFSGAFTCTNTGAATLGTGVVQNTNIADGTIANGKLSNQGITLTGSDGVSIAGGAVNLGNSKSIGLTLDGSTLAKSASGLKVGDGAIGSTQIADDSIVTAKVGDGEITNVKLSSSALSVVAGDGIATTSASISLGGTSTLSIDLDGSSLALSASGLSIAAGGVQQSHLANDSVGSAQIANNAVGTTELASDCVQSSKIAANAVIIEKCGFRGYQEFLTGSTAVKYDLARSVNANFLPYVAVFRNGLLLKQVASASAQDEYQIANNGTGGVAAITFASGQAPNGDSIAIKYLT